MPTVSTITNSNTFILWNFVTDHSSAGCGPSDRSIFPGASVDVSVLVWTSSSSDLRRNSFHVEILVLKGSHKTVTTSIALNIWANNLRFFLLRSRANPYLFSSLKELSFKKRHFAMNMISSLEVLSLSPKSRSECCSYFARKFKNSESNYWRAWQTLQELAPLHDTPRTLSAI